MNRGLTASAEQREPVSAPKRRGRIGITPLNKRVFGVASDGNTFAVARGGYRHCTVLIWLLACTVFAQDKAPRMIYRNPTVGIEQRIEDLLARMTLEEKV